MKIIKNGRKRLEIKASQLIERKIQELLKTQESVVIGIPGGRSVSGIFEILKKQPISWEKVHIFMVDERLVSLDDPDSNFNQAWKVFIEYLVKQFKLPRENMHPYIYFNQDTSEGVKAYRAELKKLNGNFDIILLSSGEEGHVASLFPNHESIRNQSEFFIALEDSPKPPKRRISASRKMLQKSKLAVLLFFGKEKRLALEKFQDRNVSINECPAKLVNKISDSYVLTDIK